MEPQGTMIDRESDYQPASHSAWQAAASTPLTWLDRSLLAGLNWEKLLYIIFLVIAIISRFWDLGARVMSHDESLHSYFSYNLATGRGYAHTPLMHGPLLFHITALVFYLFGATDYTARIAPAVAGVILVALPYLFRRWLGRRGALVTSFMLLISPSILFHARYIRQEEFILVWTLLTALCTWRYLTTRHTGWLIGLTAALALHFTDKSTAFLIVALFLAFLAPLAVLQLYDARRKRSDALTALALTALLAVLMVLAGIVFVLVSRYMMGILNLTSLVAQLNPLTLTFDYRALIFALSILVLAVLFGLLTFVLLRRLFGTWLRLAFHASAAFNVVVVMITMTMFMASPAMLLVLNPIWRVTTGADLVTVSLLGDMSNLANNMPVIATMFGLAVMMIALSVAIGVSWRWRVWLPVAGLFAGITATLFTTVFSNAAGFGTGYVGMLGYWMAQQNVQRGSQPPYYYFLLVPLYEYTLVIGAMCALVYAVYHTGRLTVSKPAPTDRTQAQAGDSTSIGVSSGDSLQQSNSFFDTPLGRALLSPDQLFPVFMLWWTFAVWVMFTIAGEKMPWLTVHFALPMALLTGWFLNAVLSPPPVRDPLNGPQTETSREPGATRQTGLFTPGRLLAMAGLAILVVLMVVRILSLVGNLDLQPGDAIGILRWVGAVAITLIFIAVLAYFLRRIAKPYAGRSLIVASFAFLSVLTIRTAFMVTYINYDYTKEFLFYAHGAPGTKIAVEQLTDLSKRVYGDMSLKVGYDSDVSWPMTWYMRKFPNARFFVDSLPDDYSNLDAIMIGDVDPKRTEDDQLLSGNYTKFNYMLVWWPMQDYFDLTWQRIYYSLVNPPARAALWDIIFNRDFTKYSQVFNKTTLTPDKWSPGHRFTLYIRNDVVNKVWDYQAGAAPAGGVTQTIKLVGPTGIALAPNGDRLVIDHKANCVVRIAPDGTIVSTFGSYGSANGKFNDAWGIAVDSDGSIYVADTFNHRIQKFDAQGNFQFAWGSPGVSTAPGSGRSTIFFGPRAIVFDHQGHLLVTDTGNKRVQVFDRNGDFLTQFGSAGSGDGQFNEPVGLAVDSQGNIYVADTWNKRIEVFDSSYKFLRAWVVDAWQEMDPNDLQSVDHKPFLAISGNILLVSSPMTHQVLGYTFTGQPVTLPGVSFNADALPTGLAVSGKTLYVTNAAGGPIQQFQLP